MPVYNLTSQKTGKIYPVNFDSQPTEADADEAISHFDSQAEVRQLKPSTQETLSENERLAKQFIAQEQRGPIQRAVDIAALVPEIGGQLIGAAKGGIEGLADIMGTRTAEQGLAGTLATLISPLTTSQGRAALGDVAQSAVEGGGRLAFDLANIMRQGAEKAKQQGLGRTAIGLTGPGMIAQALTPRTPSPEEVQTAIANQLASKAFEEERAKADMAQQAGINIGQAQPGLTEAVATFGQPESILGLGVAKAGVKAAAKGTARAAEAVSRLATTTDDLLAFTTGAEKTPQVFKARLEEGSFNEVLPDLARAKTSSGVEGVNQARQTLNKETFDIIEPVVKAIDPESTVLTQENILQQADTKLAREIDTPEVRKSALSTSRKYISDLTPDNLLSRYRDVSDQLITFWKSPDQAKFANRIKGLEAIREVLSDVIKSSLDERGVDPTIWSKYGKTNELVDQIVKNYGNENIAYKSKRGEGLLSKKGVQTGDIISRVPFAGTAIRGASNLIERAKGGTPKILNNRVDQLFEGIDPSGPILSPPNLNQLLQQVSEEAQANRQLALQRQASLGLTE